jgi:hypothetical protein
MNCSLHNGLYLVQQDKEQLSMDLEEARALHEPNSQSLVTDDNHAPDE